MTDLTDFLLARIAEDEAVAKAAIEDDGGEDEGFSGQYGYLTGRTGSPLDHKPSFGDDAARLITRFAVPARVLAECKAKRQVVELYRGVSKDARETRDELCCAGEAYLHDALRVLALPYADHPDYRNEWRP